MYISDLEHATSLQLREIKTSVQNVAGEVDDVAGEVRRLRFQIESLEILAARQAAQIDRLKFQAAKALNLASCPPSPSGKPAGTTVSWRINNV